MEDVENISYLDGLATNPKRLVKRKTMLMIGIASPVFALIHMYIVLASVLKHEQKEFALLMVCTLFVAAPFVSSVLAIALAYIPIYSEGYKRKFIFFTLATLLLIEVGLLVLTIVQLA